MIRRFLIALVCLSSIPALAQICPVSNKVPSAGDGIGDGCTTEYHGFNFLYVMPALGIFNSVFKPACDNHDKCWTQLGANYPACDSTFLSEMKDRCDSKFNKWLLPGENLACKAAANGYKQAVEIYRNNEPVIPGFQYEARQRSVDLAATINADQCGTTPERTTLYAPVLVTQINNAYLSYAGRLPTVYEFMATANAGDIVGDRTGWNGLLYTLASQAAGVQPPSAAWVRNSSSDGLEHVLTANPIVPGVAYRWRISRGNADGPTTTITIVEPKYNTTFSAKGFLRATSPTGVRNMSLIEFSAHVQGWCGQPGGQCQ